jgi:hypothetical protein
MLNQYSIFSGVTAGAAAYAATYYFSPATIGAINFAASSFFANYMSAVPAVLLGYAIPALTAMLAGVVLAALFNAVFFAQKSAETKAQSGVEAGGAKQGNDSPEEGKSDDVDVVATGQRLDM